MDVCPAPAISVIMWDQMDEDDEARNWSTSEVARELGISPSLVRTWVAYMNWEVTRNAEGHRVFATSDVRQLQELKGWLDAGNSLKAFRREQQGEGPYDPRGEMRAGYRRLKELQSQEDALLGKHRELLEAYLEQRTAVQDRLAQLGRDAGVESVDEPVAAPVEPPIDPRVIVQGVLKQLVTALMARQGKLQFVGKTEEGGKVRLEYLAPGGKKQIVEDFCGGDAERQMLETVLRLIAPVSGIAQGGERE